MKKTYKTFNGENRNCFFKVGKALVEARFTPTYITDNEFMQNAIEDSYSFKAGELQLVTPSMTWIKIRKMKYIIYPFAMLIYVCCVLCLVIAYCFMVFIHTVTDAHKASLEACENIKGFFKMLKLWMKGR